MLRRGHGEDRGLASALIATWEHERRSHHVRRDTVRAQPRDACTSVVAILKTFHAEQASTVLQDLASSLRIYDSEWA